MSALFVGNGSGARVLGFSEQWTAPTPRSPWRYGGAVRPAALVPDRGAADDSRGHGHRVAPSGSRGSPRPISWSNGDEALLLEINPRPGATLDIFDCGAMPLLRLHVEAVRDGKTAAARG